MSEVNHEYYGIIIQSLENEIKMLKEKIKKLESDIDEFFGGDNVQMQKEETRSQHITFA